MPIDGSALPREPEYFVQHLRTLGRLVQARVLKATRATSYDELAREVHRRGGDTIYALDIQAEEVLLRYCTEWGRELPFLLVAEGLDGGCRLFPEGALPEEVQFTLIVDPIDGTRGLMYGKRSGWALFGVAPRPAGELSRSLGDIVVALQAELPTPRAALADTLWAVWGGGVRAESVKLDSGEVLPYSPQPSAARSVAGGFATICKFFPGTMTAAAELEETLLFELFGSPGTSPQVFDDEYISTGGQLYELTVGRDRFVADLRPLLLSRHDPASVLCCHPYDLCTWTIAREAGVRVTDGRGRPLTAPLDTETPVSWIGYANADIQGEIEPVLQRLLEARAQNP